MGLFEPHHLLVILVIALVIFGPGKIADLGGSLGKGVRDFRKAMAEPEAPRAQPEPAPQPTALSQPADHAQPGVATASPARETA